MKVVLVQHPGTESYPLPFLEYRNLLEWNTDSKSPQNFGSVSENLEARSIYTQRYKVDGYLFLIFEEAKLIFGAIFRGQHPQRLNVCNLMQVGGTYPPLPANLVLL